MKNATAYQKKVKKLLGGAGKGKAQPSGQEPMRVLLGAILEEDASRKAAQRVLEAFEAEFVDYNELRVAPPKDMLEFMGDLPESRRKTESIQKVFNAIFDRKSALSLEHLAKLPKRDLRKHLLEIGLSTYSAALVTMLCFGGHAAPVDRALADWLEINGYIHPGSDLEDVQGFLERIVQQKDDWHVHEYYRELVEKSLGELRKYRREKEAAMPAPAVPQKAEDAAAGPTGDALAEALPDVAGKAAGPAASKGAHGASAPGAAAPEGKSAKARKGGAEKSAKAARKHPRAKPARKAKAEGPKEKAEGEKAEGGKK